jgi:hypothetical protein
MSKSGQYVIEQQEGEQEKDFSNLRPDEIKELDEWLDKMNSTAIYKPKQELNHENR